MHTTFTRLVEVFKDLEEVVTARDLEFRQREYDFVSVLARIASKTSDVWAQEQALVVLTKHRPNAARLVLEGLEARRAAGDV